FKTEAKEYKVGELIRFTDYTIGAEKWNWDFGDSTDIRDERNPYHTFSQPGKYDVRLIVNKSCEIVKTVTIEEKTFILDSTKLPIFKLPKETRVGKKINAEDNTERATTWEWRFGETANVNSYNRKAEYTYKEPGLKTVSLVINGELQYIGKRKIRVLPAPKEPGYIDIVKSNQSGGGIKHQPDIGTGKTNRGRKKAPYVSEKQFGDMLVKISKNKATSNIFLPYLCGNLNVKVVVNKKQQDFMVMCEKIRNKRIVVKNVQIVRNSKNNCITSVVVSMNRGIL
ncbi:MAG: PKD domain-containing protein, partial [Marinirhabdus sp.]